MNRFQEQCLKAKAAGYTHISSVVKSHFSTTYYNVQEIDKLVENGKWIKAVQHCFGWHGRVGTSHRPIKCLSKTELYKL